MLSFDSPSNCLFVAPVSSLLEIALRSSSSSGHPGNSSSSSSSSSNAPSNSSSLHISTSCSTAASRTFTAALPWLVLLGRCWCCLDVAAVLVLWTHNAGRLVWGATHQMGQLLACKTSSGSHIDLSLPRTCSSCSPAWLRLHSGWQQRALCSN